MYFIIILSTFAIGQNSFLNDIILIKFKSDVHFEIFYNTKGEYSIAQTGINEVDELNYSYNCTKMERLFIGSNEVLKLWYIFYINNTNALTAKQEYQNLSKYISCVDLVGICTVGYEPNDPLFNQINHKAFYDSKIPQAWDIEQGNSNLRIGIIDCGLDWDHPDISLDNIWQNLGEDSNHNGYTIYIDENGKKQFDAGDLNAVDDDNNGRTDDLAGYNFYNYNYNFFSPYPADIHGLNMFGTIAATANNEEGAAGSSYNSKIIHCKVGVSGLIDWIWPQAVQYLTDQSVDVISMSFFNDGYSQATQDVINYAYQNGSILVACAGFTSSCPLNLTTYPFGYDNVIGVGALEDDATHMRLDSRVSSKIDLLGSRTATYPSILDDQYSYGGSMHSSGTTAMTAGIVSLLKAHYPTWTNDQIVNQLFITAVNKEDYNKTNSCNFDFTSLIGHGLVDAHYALTFNGTINRDLIWNKDLKIYHNIVLQQGKTLTIRDGTNLEFQSGKTFNIYGNLVIEGDLTINQDIIINSGGSIVVNPGATLKFATGKSLINNGTMYAIGTSNQPITFTSQTGTSPNSWGSIKLNGSGASGSQMRYANVYYGTRVEIINSSNIIIQDCNITNTYDGIKFTGTSGSTGSVYGNNITTSSAGHGIIIENGSTVTCERNVVTKTTTNRSGVGILFGGGGSGTILQNEISGWDWGVGAIWGSSPEFRNNPPTVQSKNNLISNCNYGVRAYNSSWPVIGTSSNGYGYNSINIAYNTINVYFTSGGILWALTNYWGGIPIPSMFYLGSGCSIETGGYLLSDPWEEEKIAGNSVITDKESILYGIDLRNQNKIIEAKDFFISYINKHPEEQAAYVELYKCYSKETAYDLIKYFNALPLKAAPENKLLLSYLYLKQDNVQMSKKTNNTIIKENPNTALSNSAKLSNVYIALYNDNDLVSAISLFNDVLSKSDLSTSIELSLTQQAIESYSNTYNGSDDKLILPKENKTISSTELPKKYDLFSNYPNPFNPSTTISYALPVESDIKITIYDLTGSIVKSFILNTQSAGYKNVLWDGKNNYGESVSSGVYIYTIKAVSLEGDGRSFTKSSKLVLMK